jgi:hypothetical protein
MFKSAIAREKNLLTFMGVAPTARSTEVNQSVFIADRNPTRLAILLQFWDIQSSRKRLHRVGKNGAILSEKREPYTSRLALTGFFNCERYEI